MESEQAHRQRVAQLLARRHYQLEPAITEMLTIKLTGVNEATSPREPIRLLEVNGNTTPSGIMPLKFDAVPASGIDYPCIIVQITPDEYDKVKSKELPLPRGWTLGQVLPKEGGWNEY
jgi:hypothetical protein